MEALAATEAGLLPKSELPVLATNAVAIAGLIGCSLWLTLPSSARWPSWLAVAGCVGPAVYWTVRFPALAAELGEYQLLAFVPLLMVAITYYVLYESSATAHQVDGLAALMYKSKST